MDAVIGPRQLHVRHPDNFTSGESYPSCFFVMFYSLLIVLLAAMALLESEIPSRSVYPLVLLALWLSTIFYVIVTVARGWWQAGGVAARARR